ncbi:MAG: hypothetical protein JO250_17170 [Armatimonadetes bacterium]|nr:hypothetical protein [Armatimonadota bacterium]
MTIGDVLAAMGVLAAVGVGWAAALLLAALAFPERVRRAAEATVAAPGACLARGLGIFVATGVVAGALYHSPAGPVRLLGGALWAGLGLMAALGSAGIARLLGGRIQGVGTHMTPFAALTRGTALYVLAGYLPILGWFLIAPLALLFSLGGAWTALRPVRSPASGMAGPAPTPLAPPELGAGGMA